MKMKKLDYILSCFLMLLGIAIVYETLQMKISGSPGGGNPAFYPRLLAVLLIIISAFLFFGKSKEEVKVRNIARITLLVIFFFLYTFALKRVGFLVSTMVWIALTMLIVGKKNWIEVIIIPPTITFLIYLAFWKILYIPLPQGILGW